MDAEPLADTAGDADVAVSATAPDVPLRLTSYLTFTVVLVPWASVTSGVAYPQLTTPVHGRDRPKVIPAVVFRLAFVTVKFIESTVVRSPSVRELTAGETVAR